MIYLIMPIFGFAKESFLWPAETTEEGKNMLVGGIRKITQEMFSVIKKIWQEKVISILRRLWIWTESLWQNTIKPFFNNLWYSTLKPRVKFTLEKLKTLLRNTIGEKEKELRKEFVKEEEEIRKDFSRIIDSLWQKLKELLAS